MQPGRLDAAQALHRHLAERHARGGALVGPDYGIRLDYRVGRFVKSYLRALPWGDDRYYLQAQGYWTLGNGRLADLTSDERFLSAARACADQIVARQRPDGAWDYPHPGWKGRVATAEGCWAGIGLLDAHRRCADPALLAAALRWNEFMDEQVGWRRVGDGVAVNYFGGREGPPVPNNSAFTLRFLAALARASGDEGRLRRAPEILAFLASAQLPSGELPYSLGDRGRTHFQCFQYNAFQALDLIAYAELSSDAAPRPLISGIAAFLARGVEADGRVPYACDARDPEVSYHLAAVAAALQAATNSGLGDHSQAAERCYRRLLARQRPDGGFPHSRGDYGRLADRRSYPRSQAMILNHLLVSEAG